MKTITIRLPDVEAAMLSEILKGNKTSRNFQDFVLRSIRCEYTILRKKGLSGT